MSGDPNMLKVVEGLGEIKGAMTGINTRLDDMQKRQSATDEALQSRLNGLDERLRAAEKKGAVNGLVAGGAVSLVVAFLSAFGTKLMMKMGIGH